MYSKQNLNEYSRSLAKMMKTKADIFFLQDCRKQKVFPDFIKLKCIINNNRTDKVIQQARLLWLKAELQHHYSRLDALQLKIYDLHLKCTKSLDNFEYAEFISHQSAILFRCNTLFRKKREAQALKLKKILDKKATKNRPSVKNVFSGQSIR